MAINLDEKYPGRAQPKSVRYPQGAFKNRTAPDSQDGTYLEQDWANDMSGFLQWLLANAGITANGQVDNALASQYADALKFIINESGTPVGTVEMFSGSSLPENYLFADGAAISRADYPKLFSAIGTTYGSGNGSTTFNIPDLRGMFPRGLDRGKGIDAGRALGSQQDDSIQDHIHSANQSWASTGFDITGGNYPVGADAEGFITTYSIKSGGISSGRSSNETRPKNIALNFIIKVK